MASAVPPPVGLSSPADMIWTNRLLKEFDGIEARLPAGVSLHSHTMQPEAGVCRAVFDALVGPPASKSTSEDVGSAGNQAGTGSKGADASTEEADGGVGNAEDSGTPPGGDKGDGNGDVCKEDAEDSVPQAEDVAEQGEGKVDGDTEEPLDGEGDGDLDDETVEAEEAYPIAFKIEMDMGLETRYPFEAPVIRVVQGSDVIPTDLLAGDVILLPDGETWTPSNTIIGTLQDLCEMVLHAKEAGLPTGERDKMGAIERGELRAGSTLPIEALGGNVFLCTPPPAPLFSAPLMSAVARRPLDRYLGVTDRQVLELEAHRTRMNHTIVLTAIDIRSLAKLKFKRGASVTLVLRDGESMEFLTTQAHECVQTVRERLQNMGIAGHQTTAGAERQLESAKSMMTMLQEKEKQIDQEPSIALVQECMDLFRQAAELFSAAGDSRHEQVLRHMHDFLQRPEVLSILESNPQADMVAEAQAAEKPAPLSVEIDVPLAEESEAELPAVGSEESGKERGSEGGDEGGGETDKTEAASEPSTASAGSSSAKAGTSKSESKARSTSATSSRDRLGKSSSFSLSGSRDATPAKGVKDRDSRLTISKKTPSPDSNPKVRRTTTPSPVEGRTPVSRLSTARKPRLSTSSASSTSSTPGSAEKSSRSPVSRASGDSASATKKDAGSEVKGVRSGVARGGDQARARGRGRAAVTRASVRGARTASTASTRGAKSSGASGSSTSTST